MRPALSTRQEPQSWGSRLADCVGRTLATTLALLYAAVWHVADGRRDLGLLGDTLVDAGLDIERTLWLSLNDGALGWVLDVMLSKVLPIVLFGGVFARLACLGSAMGAHCFNGGLVTALLTVFRLLMPMLVISSLFMMEQPGIDHATIAVAWLLPICICCVWFWAVSPLQQGTVEPAPLDMRDALLIGGPLLALISALVIGLSLQLSAVIALGLVIAQSLLDVDVRRQPNIIPLTLAQSGVAFGKLLAAAVAVGLILTVLDRTGLPIDVAWLLAGAAGEAKLPMLVLAAMTAIAAGLIMPGFAAYLLTVALIGPALRTVGISSPTTHLLIFVVSAVAVAIRCGARSKAA